MKPFAMSYLLALLAFGPAGCESKTQRVTIGDRSFALELALDPATRERGLMHRDSIPEDGGMLFVFPGNAMRQFWMKNCRVDMDVIFLDGMGYVVSTHTMTVPEPGTPDSRLPTWSSGKPAQFAIELRAGTADKLGVDVGQRIDLPTKSLKGRAK